MKSTKKQTEEEVSINTVSVIETDQNAEMGRQLTEQYQRAIGGMREVLRFGGMMMLLSAHVENLSARGQVSGGRGNKGGISAWLEQHAPEVSRPTAYRFMAVAEAVRTSFKLPAKLAQSIDFPTLATASPDELPEAARSAQLELWSYVDGTSQRRWLLDKLTPAARGGPREKSTDTPPLSAQEKAETQAQIYFKPLYLELYKARCGKTKDLHHLPYATDTPADVASLTTLLEELQLLADQVKEVLEAKRQS